MAKPAGNGIVRLRTVPDAFDFYVSCTVHDYVVNLEVELSQIRLMSATTNPQLESRE